MSYLASSKGKTMSHNPIISLQFGPVTADLAALLLQKPFEDANQGLAAKFQYVSNPVIFREADVQTVLGPEYQGKLADSGIAFATVTASMAMTFNHKGGQRVMIDGQRLRNIAGNVVPLPPRQ